MKMCLAPCFAGCTAEEYAGEVSQVVAFLNSGGASLSQELARQREAASSELDFERAAAAHRRLEKVDAVRRGIPEIARPLDLLDAVVLERAVVKNAIALFAVRHGRISEPFLLPFSDLASQPRSAEDMLRAMLQSSDGSASQTAAQPVGDRAADESAGRESSARELEDHLGLLTRWFYGRPREGEIFYLESRPDGWPYRRILRACARLLSPPASPASG
jgi:excinuclease UvrABC nuclease subunit